MAYVCPIANPLADEKQAKRLLKLVSKASKAKLIKRGVKEVVKSVKKGQKGLVVIAGNISPVDVISHIPVLCEESSCKYVYVPSRSDLGAAAGTRRATSCVMVAKPSDPDVLELFEKCSKEL